MELSAELISQFAKITNDNKSDKKTETTMFGTVKLYDGAYYVQLDGSDLLTPVTTTTDVAEGERVTVMIKDHSATVTGNVSSPSARTDDVKDVGDKVEEIGKQITEFETVVADKVSTKQLQAEVAKITKLEADYVTVNKTLEANNASIKKLEAEDVTIKGTLEAQNGKITNLETDKLSARDADIKYATIENLDVTNATIRNLDADFGEFEQLTANNFTASNAEINNLKTNKLSATDADVKYAQIDFANIGEAAIEKLFSDSGIIKDLIVSEGKVTGELVGVTIKGDLIEGNTIKADKLVVKGSDGLYYKLNFESGNFDSAEEVPTDGIHGSVIVAESITAEKIAVDDLVAFDATIGGFHIGENSLYSGVKSSVDNTTRGIYLDNTGQLAFGDSNNYLKFHKDQNGAYRLEISANSLKISTSNKTVEGAIGDVEQDITSMKGDISSNQQAAKNANDKATAAQNAATNAQNTASGAQTTANNAQTAATNAQSTADSAKTAATNAQNTANNAQTAANNAQNSVNNMEIGGRNLLLNSSFTKDLDKWDNSGVEIITIDGVECAHIKGALATTYHVSQDILGKIDANDLTQTYVFSADVRLDNYVAGSTNPYVQLYFSGYYNNNGTSTWMGATTVSGTQQCAMYNNKGWVRMTWTVKFAIKPDVSLNIYVYGRDFTGDLYFKNLQFEKGNKPTEWRPAPEDQDAINDSAAGRLDEIDGTVNDMDDRLEANENLADKNAADIESLGGQISGHDTKITNLLDWYQGEDGIDAKFTKFRSDFDTLNNQYGADQEVMVKHIKFVDGNIHLTAEKTEDGSEKFAVVISNTKISFLEDGVEVAYISNKKLYITETEVKDSLRVGNYVTVKRANGNTGTYWVD